MVRSLLLLVVFVASTACVQARAVAAPAAKERESPFRRAIVFEGGALYLERTLDAQTVAAIPREELPAALRSMLAISDDGTATALGDEALLEGVERSVYISPADGDLAWYTGHELGLKDWERLVGHEVYLGGHGHGPADEIAGRKGLRRVQKVRVHRSHIANPERDADRYHRMRCDVCGWGHEDNDADKFASERTYEFRVPMGEHERESEDDLDREEHLEGLEERMRWAGVVELSDLGQQPPEVRAVLESLIQKSQAAARARLQARLARAPKGTVAVGYMHRLGDSVSVHGKGSFTQQDAQYDLYANIHNNLSAALPGEGRTQFVRDADIRQADTATAAACMATGKGPSASLGAKAIRGCFSHAYPLRSGLARGERNNVLIAESLPASVYEVAHPGLGRARMLLCPSNEERGASSAIAWQAIAPLSTGPVRCQASPPPEQSCSVVDVPSTYVEHALMASTSRTTQGRRWNLPALPLQDPPRAHEASVPQDMVRDSFEGARPGCAFFAETSEFNMTVAQGKALLSRNSAVHDRGMFVLPQTERVVLSGGVPRFGCGWSAGRHMEALQAGPSEMLHATDFEERAKDEAERGASAALLAQLHAAAGLMRELEARAALKRTEADMALYQRCEFFPPELGVLAQRPTLRVDPKMPGPTWDGKVLRCGAREFSSVQERERAYLGAASTEHAARARILAKLNALLGPAEASR